MTSYDLEEMTRIRSSLDRDESHGACFIHDQKLIDVTTYEYRLSLILQH